MCLNKHCKNAPEASGEPSIQKLKGIYRKMQRYYCRKCNLLWSEPVAVETRKGLKEFIETQKEMFAKRLLSLKKN